VNGHVAGTGHGSRVGAATYALLTDGSTVEIRPAHPGDAEDVRAMHAAMSPDNLYLRFRLVPAQTAVTHGLQVGLPFPAVARRPFG
jgi:hypothetical protein